MTCHYGHTYSEKFTKLDEAYQREYSPDFRAPQDHLVVTYLRSEAKPRLSTSINPEMACYV